MRKTELIWQDQLDGDCRTSEGKVDRLTLIFGDLQRDSIFEFFAIELQLTLIFRTGQWSQIVSTLASPSKTVQWSGGLRRMERCQVNHSLDVVHAYDVTS